MNKRKRPLIMGKPDRSSLEGRRKAAAKALQKYRTELKRRTLVQVLAGIVIGFGALLVGMLVAGDRFDPILAVFGLKGFNNPEGGIYADCSKKENQDNSLCPQRASPADDSWKKIESKGSRFRLSR